MSGSYRGRFFPEPSTAEQLQVLAAIDDSIQTLVHRQ